jgi:hypothetical protein
VRRTRMLGFGWIVLDASSQAKTGQCIGIWQTKRSVCEVVLDDALPWRGDSWIAVADANLSINIILYLSNYDSHTVLFLVLPQPTPDCVYQSEAMQPRRYAGVAVVTA